MLSSARKIVFWTLDFLRGGKIRKAYKNIDKYYRMDSNSIELEEYYRKTLNRLLEHATNTTNYYSDFKGKKNISLFPVVNKKTIVDRQVDFLSKDYKGKKLIKMSTSGSTGTPFTSYQNINKKRCVNAETIYFNGKAGYQVGSKLIFLRSLNRGTTKSKVTQLLQNIKLIDVNKLDESNIRKLIKDIESYTRNNSATILSYASTYDALRDYFKLHGPDSVGKCNIHGIISTSEILYDKTRKYISETFKCRCYSRYANMENGMLGQDTPEHPNTFIINEANYYIEILKLNEDIPAEFGEVGRIVVTDLYNYAMPMIRYDTGDIGSFTFVEMDGVKKKAITNFGGRKIDTVYDSNGNIVSPHKISVTFWNFVELEQFQFIQEEKNNYTVLIKLRKTFEREEELIENLRAILGTDAVITLKIVDNIPPLPSGKRKYIMNNTLEN